MPQSPRLEVRNLVKHYGATRVVDDVSLSIAPGQVTCLLGPSGCGKSTTLRMIAGVDMQDSGSIHVDGDLVCDTVFRIPPERRKIGLMFQDFALFPHLSVRDNVGFGLSGSSKEKLHRISTLLERVGLGHYLDAFPHELSGGEQQRVALVRALAPKPRIMLMDEPFSGLDNRLRDEIRDDTLSVLKEENASVLLVTHEPEEAMRMADEIALMREGRVVQSGAPYNIYNAPVDRKVVSFFSDINMLSGVIDGASVDTAFGQFFAPGFENGTKVEIVFRPQHVNIDFDRAGQGPNSTEIAGTPARAVVERARLLGSESLVEFMLCDAGTKIKAKVPNVFLPKPGTVLWLTVRRKRCFVFAQKAD